MNIISTYLQNHREEQVHVVKSNDKVEFQTSVGRVILTMTLDQYRELSLSNIYIKGVSIGVN